VLAFGVAPFIIELAMLPVALFVLVVVFPLEFAAPPEQPVNPKAARLNKIIAGKNFIFASFYFLKLKLEIKTNVNL
jgi:hypothetical protein